MDSVTNDEEVLHIRLFLPLLLLWPGVGVWMSHSVDA